MKRTSQVALKNLQAEDTSEEELHGSRLEFWLEHVVHWHLLLVAVVAVLSFGYLFFSQQVLWAGE